MSAGPPPRGTVTLDESYRRCRELNRRYGTTYFWSTYALPRIKRHHVWALYAFCRYADDIVDDLGGAPAAAREAALIDFGDRFFADLEAGRSGDPVLKGVVHTVRAFGHDPEVFRRFLRSMAMDLTVATYATWDDLLGYMDGSAAVIGEMMLPILEPADPSRALGPARDLGFAFQLTNFLRDVAEDLGRGRVYIPQEDLARFGADPARRLVDGPWVHVMRFEIDRCRDLYRSAAEGVALLPPSSARCVHTALVLYQRILDGIEAASYDVFSARVRVPTWQKAAMLARTTVARPAAGPGSGAGGARTGAGGRVGSARPLRVRPAAASPAGPKCDDGPASRGRPASGDRPGVAAEGPDERRG